MPESIIPYWKLTTGTQRTGSPPGAMRKIAAYLNTNKKIGDVFTAAELRREIVGGKLESNENLTRRLRELREIGWVFDSYKTDSAQQVDTYILNKVGWHPELSENPERKRAIDQKTRRHVFERDGLSCCICGIGAKEKYPNENDTARLTIGHIVSKANGGSDLIENLQTECAKCNEPFRDNTKYDGLQNSLNAINDLSAADKLSLKKWIERGKRDTTVLDKAFHLTRRLNEPDKTRLLAHLAGEDERITEKDVVTTSTIPKNHPALAAQSIAHKNVSGITYHSDGIHPALVSAVPTVEPLNTVESELLELFKAHKDYAIQSNRNGSTGIGKTFEDLLGKGEDNLSLPDFQGLIELKARDMESSSMIGLFTKSPDYLPASAASFLDHKVNSYLLRNYGYIGDKGEKRLCTTLSAKETVYPKGGNFGFALEIDDVNKFIHIVVIDRATGKEVFKDAGWTYEMLLDTSKKKLGSLALISAQKRVMDGKTHYIYRHLDMIDGLDNAGLIDMIKQDIVRIDLRMKMREDDTVRDHGTAFRIQNKNLISVYKTRRLA